ncbi:tetratricopeptide repeat protein [Bacteroides sp. OM05-12]|nr:tetratricopeptide repeat protein [Bacteroides sp. OM05-12]
MMIVFLIVDNLVIAIFVLREYCLSLPPADNEVTFIVLMKPIFILFVFIFLLCSCSGDRHTNALALYQEGELLEKLNIPDSAVNAYRKAADLLEGSQDYELICKVYNQLGDLLLIHEVYDRALVAHQKALKYGLLLEDKSCQSKAYRGIGKNYYLRKDTKEALTYFIRALQLKDRIKDKEECSSIYNNLSNAYGELKDYEKALEYNSEAIRLTEDSLKIYRNYAVRGRLSTLLQRYDSAYYYLVMASRSGDARIQASCYFKLSEMPVESGVTDSMKYEYLNKAHLLSDSIEDISKSVQITETEHIRQLELLKNKEKNKLIFIVSFSLSLVLLVVFCLYYRYKRRIRAHQKKINDLYADHVELRDERELNNDSREKQIIAIVSRAGNACLENFMTTSFYTELKNKLQSEDCVFNYAEQDELQKVIFKEFDNYIQQISNIINLSSNDILLCCLSLLKLTTKECAICRGVSSETIRSQRTRIKKKIPKTFLENGFFSVIFGEE